MSSVSKKSSEKLDLINNSLGEKCTNGKMETVASIPHSKTGKCKHKADKTGAGAAIPKCNFFITKKNRHCKMLAMPNGFLCAEHFDETLSAVYSKVDSPSDSDNSAPNTLRPRMKCPFDPKHSCFIDSLEDHMSRCNMRPVEPKPYFAQLVNAGPQPVELTPDVDIEDEGMSLRKNMDLKTLVDILDRIVKAFDDHIPKVGRRIGVFKSMIDEIETPGYGPQAKRHLIQVSSLLSNLEKNDLLKPSTCFVELGCGKGMLSYFLGEGVATQVDNPKSCRLVLVDRTSHRHKRDNKLKGNDLISVERIRVDLADLLLGELDGVKETDHTVGFSKHLCGEAADLALKCLLENNSKVDKLKGILIANCCHHKCTWNNYVGKKFLEEWGFTEREFRTLTGISSWAVCGTGKEKFDSSKESESEEAKIEEEKRKEAIGELNLELTVDDRRVYGTYVKKILDYGRLMYVKSFGLKGSLFAYADLSETLENMAMIAVKP